MSSKCYAPCMQKLKSTPEWVQPQTLYVHGTSDVIESPVREEFRYLTAEMLLEGARARRLGGEAVLKTNLPEN